MLTAWFFPSTFDFQFITSKGCSDSWLWIFGCLPCQAAGIEGHDPRQCCQPVSSVCLFWFALQDIAIQFFKFVEEKFPAMDGMSLAKIVLSKQSKVQKKNIIRCLLLQSTRTYCKEIDLAHEGAVLLRPWMLPWRMDYGLRGTSDVVPRCEMLEFFSVLGSFIVFCLETDFNLYHLLNHCCPGRMFNGAWCSSCAIKASRVTLI